ncbi:MAG TPA: hypothetical protein VF189_01595 [Patescibacteria group bacterium]
MEDLKPTPDQSKEEQLQYIKKVQKRNEHARRGRENGAEYIDKVYYCEHVDEDGTPCDKLGTTRDHITPKSIARRLGWTPEQIGAPENIQHLCREHHNGREGKDKDSEARKELLKAQLGGRVKIGYKEHKPWIKAYDRMLHERRKAQRVG